MADRRSDGDKQDPTLELPKLFGRRRSRLPTDDSPADQAGESSMDDTVTAPAGVSTGSTTVGDTPTTVGDTSTTPPGEEPGARRADRADRARPALPPRLAAVLTGLLVGAAGTLLTYGALRGCETLTGTGSCGGGPGLLLLVAIFAVMVLLGGALLKLWAVGEPQSTSFLAVGITAVMVMLTLLEAVFSAWMFVAVPLVSMAAYWAAHWVTTRFDDTDREASGLD
jgi:hypothetical protein